MIDLRSDILAPMRPEVACAFAEVATRAPAFEAEEDSDEKALLDEIKELFGFEGAILVPTGTLANQIALKLWCKPGDTIIADRGSHVASNEAASTAGLAGIQVASLDGEDGHLSPSQIDAALSSRQKIRSVRKPQLVCLENTHNRAGGTLMPTRWLPEIATLCHARGVQLHLDGARIWNALAAGHDNARLLAQGVGSLALNLNKALGAPLGSVLLLPRDAIEEGHFLRRILGGWWRPLGPVAAAARAALKDYRPRLQQDHKNAQLFATTLLACGGDVLMPQTNIVMLDVSDADINLIKLAESGVLASRYGAARIRFVFHNGIDTAAARKAAELVCRVIEGEEST
ncbi:threonine aldolase family protein [Roseibium sp. M-1]